MKPDFRDILFWIFLIFSLILIVWNVFGNSPTEFIAMVTILLTIFLKTWQISERQVKSDMRFGMLARDFRNHIQEHKQQFQKPH